MTKKLQYIPGLLLVALNLFFFIPLSFGVITTGGGAMGFGLLLLPITLVGHFYLVPSIMSFTYRFRNSQTVTFINMTGIIGSLFWLWIFFSS